MPSPSSSRRRSPAPGLLPPWLATAHLPTARRNAKLRRFDAGSARAAMERTGDVLYVPIAPSARTLWAGPGGRHARFTSRGDGTLVPIASSSAPAPKTGAGSARRTCPTRRCTGRTAGSASWTPALRAYKGCIMLSRQRAGPTPCDCGVPTLPSPAGGRRPRRPAARMPSALQTPPPEPHGVARSAPTWPDRRLATWRSCQPRSCTRGAYRGSTTTA